MTSTTTYTPARAIEVRPGESVSGLTWRIWAVVPGRDCGADIMQLLGDLAGQARAAGTGTMGPRRVELTVVVVDNASQSALADVRVPADVRTVDVRLADNAGGSGGFNAGMGLAIERMSEQLGAGEQGLVWLLDSDARVEPGALRGLIDAMEESPEASAVGSMLCDPRCGSGHELGGSVDRRGEYVPNMPSMETVARGGSTPVAYAAACSLLVRMDAACRAGLMSDLFINGDDVEWCHRLRRCAGGRRPGGDAILATAGSRVRHPAPDRMRTWQRYYAARNAMTVLTQIGAGQRALASRALREAARAAGQALVGRDDLARLHLRGLEDAARGRVSGAAPAERVRCDGLETWERFSSWVEGVSEIFVVGDLESGVRTRLEAACAEAGIRLRAGRSAFGVGLFRFGRAIAVSARGRRGLVAGRVVVTCTEHGFAVRRTGTLHRAVLAAAAFGRGCCLAMRLALLGVPTAPPIARTGVLGTAPKTGVVVLSYNRKRAVMEKLTAIDEDPAFETGCVLVVDNASTDGTREAVRRQGKGVSLLSMGENVGVAAFNRGVESIESEYVLILDDDAHPADGALERAVEVLDTRPEIGAVTLHPRHPGTLESEWRFAERVAGPSDAWPVMGCGNLVRRADWMAAQGYEERFFLYRNDTDLALKLLSMGRGVYFDPELVVWHDSAAIQRKNRHWFRGATRNWVWMCRRHGRGWTKVIGIAAGYAWTHRLAGLDPMRHAAAVRGFLGGMLAPAPPLPSVCDRRVNALRQLLRLRFGRYADGLVGSDATGSDSRGPTRCR